MMLDRPSPTTDTWTEERVELLKRLWLEGLSAGQIAGVLGEGVTRNAVIGKVTRLKLAKRKNPTAFIRPPANKPHGNKGAPKAAAIVHRAITRVPDPIPEFIPEDGVDVTHLLGIMELRAHTCRWYHGDPRHPDTGFCGRHTRDGSPYCNEHHHRAYHS
jgi:GcrA cell cycle regulator